jgi:hypothetical protein
VVRTCSGRYNSEPPHDRLSAVQADLAFAGRRDVEIRLAYQQRAEFGFAQCAEEFGEAAARHVEFQRLFVMTQNLEFDDWAEAMTALQPDCYDCSRGGDRWQQPCTAAEFAGISSELQECPAHFEVIEAG